jgi:hypothetical protein
MSLRPTLLVIGILISAFGFSGVAFADGQSVSGCTGCNGYTFQATLNPVSGSSGTYALSYTITNVSGATANPYSWSVTLFNSGNSISSPTGVSVIGSNGIDYTSAYQVLAGKSNNGNSNCNGTLSDAICVKTSGTGSLPAIGQGQSVTFTFDFTCLNCTELASWTFLSQGNCVSGSGNCYAISTNGTVVSMPEPSIVALYLSTFAVLAAGLLWRAGWFTRWSVPSLKVHRQLL